MSLVRCVLYLSPSLGMNPSECIVRQYIMAMICVLMYAHPHTYWGGSILCICNDPHVFGDEHIAQCYTIYSFHMTWLRCLKAFIHFQELWGADIQKLSRLTIWGPC